MSKQTDLINIPDAITVDGSGTAGFGVTPSPWRSLYGDKQVDIGAHSSVYSEAGNTTYLANNFYRNASNAFIYKTTSGASYVSLSQEKVIFAGAASGTAGNSFSFSERARFDSDGLKFNGDTAAANALNDYEEGTWTPFIRGSSTAGSISGSNRLGWYTKVGDMVTAWFDCDGVVSGASGNLEIAGLPFSSLSGGPEAIGSLMVDNVNTDVNAQDLTIYLGQNSTYMNIFQSFDNTYWAPLTVTNETVAVRGTITYKTGA